MLPAKPAWDRHTRSSPGSKTGGVDPEDQGASECAGWAAGRQLRAQIVKTGSRRMPGVCGLHGNASTDLKRYGNQGNGGCDPAKWLTGQAIVPSIPIIAGSFMTKRAVATTAILGGLLASPWASASPGFRPGLWAIHEVFIGSLQLSSQGLRCLQSLGQGPNILGVLSPANGPSGPVSVHIKRGIHKTEVLWHDDLRFGSMTNSDRGRYTFTDHAGGDLLRGSWTRTQTVSGHTTILHETLRGHWVKRGCPSVLPPATVSSPTLAALNAQAAGLKAAAATAQAQMAHIKAKTDKFP